HRVCPLPGRHDLGHVRGAAGRVGAERGADRSTGASLHATAALSGARSGSGAATRARGTRSATQPARAAERLPVSSALSVRDGCLQAQGAAERHSRRRPRRGVLATCRPRRAAVKRKRSPGGGTREGETKEVRKVELASGVLVPRGGVPVNSALRRAVHHGGDRSMNWRPVTALLGVAALLFAACQQGNNASTAGGKVLIAEPTTG